MMKRTDFLDALRAGWWMVPVVVVAALGSVAYLTSDPGPPTYESTATLAAVPHHTLRDENQILRSVELLERRTMVSTLARIPEAMSVLRGAAERLERPVGELRDYDVRSLVVPSTNLIRVTVRGPEAELVSRLGAAVISTAVEEAGDYYRVFALKIVEGPAGPGRLVSRGAARAYVVGGLLGLLLGVAAAYVVGLLRVIWGPQAAVTSGRQTREAQYA